MLRPIHCGPDNKNPDDKVGPVLDGIWTTLVGTASEDRLKTYIQNSKTCTKNILPKIVKKSVTKYEKSDGNKIRSMRTLYEGGLISSRKYTKIRNCGDGVKSSDTKEGAGATEFLPGCTIPKLLPYKFLISYIRGIDIGEVLALETLAEKFSLDAVPGMFRPLEPFMLSLADHYLFLDSKVQCLHWFNGETFVFYVAVGADGAPFGQDETATGK